MKQDKVTLSEGQLRKIVKESIRMALNEAYADWAQNGAMGNGNQGQGQAGYDNGQGGNITAKPSAVFAVFPSDKKQFVDGAISSGQYEKLAWGPNTPRAGKILAMPTYRDAMQIIGSATRPDMIYKILIDRAGVTNAVPKFWNAVHVDPAYVISMERVR